MTLDERAEHIATLIQKCDTDERGDLLMLVAAKLRRESQGYTAVLIEAAGKIYNGETPCPRP